MSLSIGARFGPYEVLAALGAGGMGEVYRAHDTTLHRDVAIKALPAGFAHDRDRLARFQREAESLATLNHPNVAQVFGFETVGETRAIVMELVPGRTLASHIAEGPLPIDDVLAIARQVALALEAAHEHGIVHRDLKPGNIIVRDDGVVKVLDFGLARTAVASTELVAPSSPDAQSPTMTSPARTQMGLILGTAAYMAPEQARGKTVDKRADLWAFGCVLYEMLTGRVAFQGADVTETLAKVIEGRPDWSALPPATPPALRRVLRRCLTKDRGDRLADASSARLDVDEAISEPTGAALLVAQAPWWRRPLPWPLVAAAVAVPLIGVMWPVPGSETDARVSRLDIALPPGDAFPGEDAPGGAGPVISPDGRTVFYAAVRNGTPYLFKRSLDGVDAVIVPGTEGVTYPFVFPTGDWLGFASGRPAVLSKVPVSGGPATSFARAKTAALGVAVAATGDVFFGDHTYGLFRVPAGSGDPVSVLPIDDAGPQRFPIVLPDGRGLLFTVGGVPVSNRLAILPAGETQQRFLTSGTDARYLSSGHLVFWRDGSLWAAPFDLSRLALADEGVPVVEGVGVRGSGSAAFAVAANGTLAYIEASSPPARTLVWVDRSGHETPLSAPAGPYAAPRLSPDDSKVILSYRTGATEDIWLHDIARGVTEPFIAEPASEWLGTWTPDGDRVLFTSRRAGPFHLYAKRANGLGDIELVVNNVARPFGRTPDGRGVLIQGSDASIALLTIADGTTKPLWTEAGEIGDARLSPDGRWIAYDTGPSGAREQIWVRPYPDVQTNRWRISPDGGQFPRWSADGRTIFFQRGTAMMAVNVRTGPPFSHDPPVRLFDGAYVPSYDVARDGRFLMITEPTPPAAANRIVVVLNWVQDMTERLARR